MLLNRGTPVGTANNPSQLFLILLGQIFQGDPSGDPEAGSRRSINVRPIFYPQRMSFRLIPFVSVRARQSVGTPRQRERNEA
jgi:hypothetical protein